MPQTNFCTIFAKKMIHFEYLPFEELSVYRLYEIMARRQDVFCVEQNCPYLDPDGLDFQALHLMGLDESGDIAVYARLLPEGSPYEGYQSMGRVLTVRGRRREGLGKALVEKALEVLEASFGSGPIKISAQSYLVPFYSGFGFAPSGPEYLEDGIPHTPMIKK